MPKRSASKGLSQLFCFIKYFTENLLLLGIVNKGLVMEKFWDAGIPCLHPPRVRRGGGVSSAPIL